MGDTPLPTVAETVKLPAYPTATWQLTPTRSGLLPVAVGRGGPLNIGWEIHGEGPVQVVLIMGLGSFKSVWQRQTLFFGHARRAEFSVLLLDNRGMGDSDKPLMRYSTSEMARDVLEVLEHVGFVSNDDDGNEGNDGSRAGRRRAAPRRRTIHIVGSSMGGMIAQELACLIPDRIASLALCSTAAVVESASSSFWANVMSRLALLVPQEIEVGLPATARRLFAASWLTEPDNAQLPKRGEHLVAAPAWTTYGAAAADSTAAVDKNRWYESFASNYERFVAQEMHKRQDPRFSTTGYLLQLVATGWHYKSPAQLAAMADAVGRERILVLHGTVDNMLAVQHGRKLIEYLQPGTPHIVKGVGHAPYIERTAWYNDMMLAWFRAGEKRARR